MRAGLLGAAVQHHVRRDDDPGHGGPADRRRRVHRAQCRRSGSDFFSLNARVSRTFRLGGRVRLEGLAEAFNLTNHANVVTRNTNFGAGAYPTNPSPTFGQITAVGDPRSFQFGARLRSEGDAMLMSMPILMRSLMDDERLRWSC